MKSAVIIFIILLTFSSFAKQIQEGVFIEGNSRATFELIKSRSELTIDHVSRLGFEVYGPIGLKKYLLTNHIEFKNFEKVSKDLANEYPTYLEIENELKLLSKKFPNISKLYSIGKSVKGKQLWVVKLSKNVLIDDNRPEFKYVANMHGDEIVGRELMIRFIKYLANSYGHDNRVTQLLDNYQIHILASMNPDGAEKHMRANSNGADLNRDFPDFSTSDNQNSTKARQPETIAVMNWQKNHNFILSANFHGGAEVVNFPWDTAPDKFPSESLVKDVSLKYANEASYIGTSTSFENGITNGFAWYEVNGGMQDWSIYYHNDFQVTIELSNTKWPAYTEIDYYFEQNKNALMGLIEDTQKIKSSGGNRFKL